MSSTPSAASAATLKPGTFDVDATGQATYRIPIEVPPGVAGAQPQLALAYGHRAHDGLLGVGWSLAGLSFITRTKATYAIDGFNGAVAYDANDRYMLDGQRLINMEGSYGGPGSLYFTELQSWNRVRAGATPEAGFTLCTRNGEIHEFGQTADSRITVPGGTDIRVWALNATADRNGNRVEYHYTLGDNPSEGAYYPDEIRYNVRDGMEPSRLVKFTYEARPDAISGFAGGHPMFLSRRMTAITTSLSGDVVRTYSLAYRTSSCTQLSCIQTITETAGDGSSLSPTSIIWSDVDAPGFVISSPSTLDQHLGQPDLRPLQASGSGHTDLVQLWTSNDNQLHATLYLATPNAGDVSWARASDTTLGGFGTLSQVLLCDLTGNGRTDLLVAFASGASQELTLAAFLANGTGFDDGGTFDTGDTWSPKHIQFFAMDANGDGRVDLVEAFAHFDPTQGDLLTFRTYLSKFGDGSGGMFTDGIVTTTADAANPTTPLAFWPMDVNGDGAVDLVRVWLRGSDNHIIADAYVSQSTALDQSTFSAAVESDLGTFSLANQVAFLPVDVNGDGIQDLLQVWQDPSGGTTTLHLTTFLCDAAGHFAAGPDSAFPNQVINDFHVMDLDGGGTPAVVSRWVSGNNELMFTAYRASPSGVFRSADPFDAGPIGSNTTRMIFFAGDANGDGKGDLLRVRLDQNQQLQVVAYLSAGAKPDLATSITNPLGGVATIEYAPLTDPTVYQPALPSFPASTALRQAAPIAPAQFETEAVIGQAQYVVSAFTEANDPTRNRFAYSARSTMQYTAAQINLLGRGWQGFASVTRSELDRGRKTVRSYNQNFPATGTLASTRILAMGQSDTAAALSTSEYQAFVRGTGVSGTSIVEVLQISARYEQDTASGTPDFVIGQTFAYDDFGSVTTHAYLGYVDPATGVPLDPTQSVYRYISYQNDAGNDRWALGYVLDAKDSANAQDSDITMFAPGDYHLEVNTYTLTHDVATNAKWDDTHGAFLVTSYAYDVCGNRTAETKPGGAITNTEYDPQFNTFRMRTIAPANAQGVRVATAFGLDPRVGLEVARQIANGSVVITTRDAFGRKLLVQGPVPTGTSSDPNGVSSLVTGNDALRAVFAAAAVVTIESTTYRDDGAGGIYSETSKLQSFPTDGTRAFCSYQSYVDGRARERQTVRETGQSAGNAIVRTDFDSDGKIILQTAPFFSTTSTVTATPNATLSTYDVLQRTLTRSVPSGEDGSGSLLTTWVYGSGGSVTMTTSAGTSAAFVQFLEQRYFRDKLLTQRSTADPHGAAAVTQIHYDPIGRVIGTTDPPTSTNPAGVSNVIVVDSLDRRVSLDNPDQNTTGASNTKALAFVHDPSTGLLATRTDAAGATMTFTHDLVGRVLTQSLSDGRTVSYTYDDPSANAGGLVTQVKVANGDALESQYDYGYDLYGNAARVVLTIADESAPFVTATTFDPQQRSVVEILPDGTTVTRTYDHAQLVSLQSGDARVDYPLEQMIAAEKPSVVSYASGAVTSKYGFNPLGQVYHENVGNTGGTVVDLAYGYDGLDQLTGIGNTESFTYANRRLTAASTPVFGNTTYACDNSGNLLDKDGVAFTYTAHYPVQGTSGGATVFSAEPDECGRTRKRTANGRTLLFDYDGLGCLRRVSDANGVVREMVSDATGDRIVEKDAQRTVLYISAAFRIERTSDGVATAMRMLFDARGVAAEITGTTVHYHRRDFKGNTTHLFDVSGALAGETAYDAFGLPRVLSGTLPRAAYEQRAWSDDLGLYYFGARYYDPFTGRFLTPDTGAGARNPLQPDALNRFAFELNNPINIVDPTGNMADWVGGLIAGLVLVAIGAALIVFPPAALGAGAAAVLGGAALGAGLNGIVFSATHTDVSGGTFWAGWGASVAVGAAIGAATAGLSTGVVAPLAERATLSYLETVAWGQAASKLALFGIRAGIYAASGAVMGAAFDATNQFMSNVIDKNIIHDPDVSYESGVGRAAITGMLFGIVAGVGQASVEAAYLQARFGGYAFRPQEMRAIGAAVGDGLGNPYPVMLRPPNIVKVRALLFVVTELSAAGDAWAEAKGL